MIPHTHIALETQENPIVIVIRNLLTDKNQYPKDQRQVEFLNPTFTRNDDAQRDPSRDTTTNNALGPTTQGGEQEMSLVRTPFTTRPMSRSPVQSFLLQFLLGTLSVTSAV